ncbi:cytochrome P450 [Micromonospora sp. NPDC047812]|uniref:cytochrome P450 n=1 Tax=Micromonospora sp. NPDC047812 TaxID=3155742 RepID=UPI00345622B3
MSEGRGTDVTDIFDYRAERDGKSPFHPPVKYQMLRDQSPVSQVNMWDGSKAWFVTRRDDVRAALADERLSADNRRPGFPLLSRGSETLTDNNPTFARMDPPEHTRQRAMVNADFTQRPAARWRPQIQQIVDRLVDEMLAKSPPADLVGELAEPLAAQVMCLVLDIPYEEDFFQRVASTFADHYVGQDKLDVASDELTSFITGILEAKAANPGGDLLSRLITQQEANGELTRDDIIAMTRVMIVAGYEPAVHGVSLGLAALFFNPDQLALLRDNPSLIASGLGELLRYSTNFHTGLPRVAIGDTEIGGQKIKTGEAVLVYLPTANFDPQWFEDPDSLDLRRSNSGNVSFGHGLHRCLGQHVVKIQMEIVLETLLRRIPDMRLAVDLDQIRFAREAAVYGVYELPVTW